MFRELRTWHLPTAIACLVFTAPLPTQANQENYHPSTIAIDSAMTYRFSAWLAAYRQRALSQGVSPKVLYTALADLRPDPDVIRFARNQPEHTRTAGEYITRAVSQERITTGREKLDELVRTLVDIEQTFNVPPQILIAVWGLESTYGTGQGSRSVLRSLATLAAFEDRRSAFWEKQLSAALKIVEDGDSTADSISGSWAGAMGHTQFIPTTFLSFAVDYDRDGKRDIWRSESDALASAANYLKSSGWNANLEWGWEVDVPDGYNYAKSGLDITQPVAVFAEAGVRRIDAQQFPDEPIDASLILPQSARGPAFLVTSNFRAILAYNNSVSYALAVVHLADRIRGRGHIQRPWPETTPLNRDQRMELQQQLMARGYDTGGVDGIIGRNTVAAIRTVQRAWGTVEDGFADLSLLKRLRSEPQSSTTTSKNPASGSED